MEWNMGCGRDRSGGGQHQNFLLEFARFTQVVLPTSGGGVRTPGPPWPATPLSGLWLRRIGGRPGQFDLVPYVVGINVRVCVCVYVCVWMFLLTLPDHDVSTSQSRSVSTRRPHATYATDDMMRS